MNRARRDAAVSMLVIIAAVASVAHAAEPTSEEQYYLEIVNRMRVNPQRELSHMVNIIPGSPAAWGDPASSNADVAAALEFFNVDADVLYDQWQLLVPAPALAWSNELHDAAAYHNTRMIFHDAQEHEFPGEPGLVQRIEDRGYDNWQALGENIFAYTETVDQGHAAFAIDWGFGPGGIQDPPGHRDNIMDPGYREIGIAITPESDPTTEVGPLVVTQDFGAEFGAVFATGVHYDDTIQRNNFYTQGEGTGGMTVTAYLPGTTTVVATTTTSASGGYKLDLNPGTYDIAFTGPGRDFTYRNVVMGTNNVKLDSITSWIRDGDGSWHDAANWFAGIPNGEGTVASLHDAATAQRTINVTTPVSVGTINFENPAGYRIAGPGVLSIDIVEDFRGRINVIGAGSHEIAAGLATADGVDVSIDQGGTLTLSGPIALSKQFVKTGPGVLNINGPQANLPGAELALRGGVTNIRTDAGSTLAPVVTLLTDLPGSIVNLESTQHLRSVTIGNQARVNLTPGGNKVLYIRREGPITPLLIDRGRLDLSDNDMIVQSTASSRQEDLDTVVNQIRSARNSTQGAWQGDGITSSAAAQNPLTGLAAMLNPGLVTFSGEAVDENAILIKHTWNGDANLDGLINADDYFRIDSGFLAQPADPTYAQGNFNYDTAINADDYFLIDSAFLGQTGVLSATIAAVAVPEPTVAMLAMGAAFLACRRRR